MITSCKDLICYKRIDKDLLKVVIIRVQEQMSINIRNSLIKLFNINR